METMKLENVSFSYGDRKVLDDINYNFESGKIYAIVWKSGAGKTTLLSLLSGLRAPGEGTIYLNDEDIGSRDKYLYRSSDVGVIFQDFNLLTKLTAQENVKLSLEISNQNRKKDMTDEEMTKRSYEVLEEVGLNMDEANRRILKLSGGQQQRVAIARALSYDPDVILADEPTGNLDEDTQKEIMTVMKSLARNGKCVIIVTHSPYVADLADEKINLKAARRS